MTFSRIRGNSSDEKMVHPNHIVYRKMEYLINQMLNNEDGVPIKTVKSFLSKIPSVFTGSDIVAWILRNVEVADLGDALHLAHLLASHGYIFQIDDHVLTVKNDGTFYRFQTPYFWPSNCWEPENTDYAVYLCKRTMQNKAHLELEDFEAENLAKLQKMFSRKWEFVFMQAEAQYKVDKKRDRLERQILDSQERAFWDVHRPVPGCVNTTEVDFRKLSRSGRPKYSASNNSVHAATCSADCQTHHQHMLRCAMMDGGSATPAAVAASAIAAANGADPKQVLAASSSSGDGASSSSSGLNYRDSKVYHQRPGLRRCTHMSDSLKYEIGILQNRLAKNVLKTSKVIENYLQYYDHRKVFDAFLVQLGSAMDPFQGQPNPWISDTVDFWQHDRMCDSSTGDISTRRLKLWEESFEELLSDMLGRETLQKFLDKEYSGENLRFWWEVQKLRKCSCRMVPVLVTEIYNEFIDTNATSPVNIDCKVMEITEENLTNPNRWSFDEAADHIFCLMKNDSYQRFLRSDIYRDLVNLSRKKVPVKLSRDIGLRFPNLSSFTTNQTKRDSNNSQQQQQQQQQHQTAPSSATSTSLSMNPPFGSSTPTTTTTTNNNNINNSSSNNNVPHLIHMSSAPGPSGTSPSPSAPTTSASGTGSGGDRASPSSSHSLHQSSTTIGLNDF